MEDLDPDLVLDMKTLRSRISTRCTSFRALRSLFLETSYKRGSQGTLALTLRHPLNEIPHSYQR